MPLTPSAYKKWFILVATSALFFTHPSSGKMIPSAQADDVLDEETRSTMSSDPTARRRSKKGTPQTQPASSGSEEGGEWKTIHSEKKRVGRRKGTPSKKTVFKIDEKTQKIETGQVGFKLNSDEPTAAASVILKNLARFLASKPEINVRIEGHADSVGYDQQNQEVSQKRADRVKEILIKEGIAAERLDAVGKGDRYPLASNVTPAGQEKNRRVEFYVSGSRPQPPVAIDSVPIPSTTPAEVTLQPETQVVVPTSPIVTVPTTQPEPGPGPVVSPPATVQPETPAATPPPVISTPPSPVTSPTEPLPGSTSPPAITPSTPPVVVSPPPETHPTMP